MNQLEAAAGLVGVVAASAVVYATARQKQRGKLQSGTAKRTTPELFAFLPEGFVPLAEPDEVERIVLSAGQAASAPIRARRVPSANRSQTPRPATGAAAENPRELLSLIGTMQWERALAVIQAEVLAKAPDVAAAAEAAVLERIRALPDSDAQAGLAAWRVLAALAPANQGYAEKVAQCHGRIESRRQALLARFPRDEDRFEAGLTWYNHPWNPAFDDVRRPIWPYIGVDSDGRVSLRLRTNWLGDSRISVRGIEVVYDSMTETLTRGAFKIDAEALGWEWRDEEAGIYQIEVLRSLVGASDVTLRYLGDPWPCEADLSEEDKQTVAEIIELHDLMRASQPAELAQAA